MAKNKLNDRIQSLASSNSLASTQLPMTKRPPLAQKDREEREDAYKLGVLDCLNGKKLACVFLDFSDAGARIKLQCASSLPNHIRVAIPSIGFSRDAEVRWQSGSESGLRFLG